MYASLILGDVLVVKRKERTGRYTADCSQDQSDRSALTHGLFCRLRKQKAG